MERQAKEEEQGFLEYRRKIFLCTAPEGGVSSLYDADYTRNFHGDVRVFAGYAYWAGQSLKESTHGIH